MGIGVSIGDLQGLADIVLGNQHTDPAILEVRDQIANFTDRDRIAFKQGSGSLSQTIVGLTAGEQYWIQFFYDARGCCGGTIQSINVKWNDTSLDSIPNVVPTGGPPYRLRNVPFTPDSDTGTLTLEVVIVGDATALFDAVSIVQRPLGSIRNGALPSKRSLIACSAASSTPGGRTPALSF